MKIMDKDNSVYNSACTLQVLIIALMCFWGLSLNSSLLISTVQLKGSAVEKATTSDVVHVWTEALETMFTCDCSKSEALLAESSLNL